MRAKDGRIEAIFTQLAGTADLDIADHRQTFDIRVQGTNAVGQLLRQHRDHATGKIHRVAPLTGLAIQRHARPDVVRDIGNRNHQAPATASLFAIHRVVEIPGRFAVDGDQRQLAQILAPLEVGFADLGRRLGVFDFRHRRKLEGQIVFAQRNFDLHSGIGIVADHFADAPDRLRVLIGLLDDIDHHHLTRLRRQLALGDWRNQDILRNPAIFRDHESDAMINKNPPNHALVRPLGHFDNTALGSPLAVYAGHPDQRPITVQSPSHLALIEKNILPSLIPHQKTVAILMPLNPASDQTGLFRYQISPLAVAQQLPFALHGAQTAQKHLFLAAGYIQQWNDLVGSQRTSFGFHDFKDVLPRR